MTIPLNLMNYLEGCLQASSQSPQILHFQSSASVFHWFLETWGATKRGILCWNLADHSHGFLPFSPFLEITRVRHSDHPLEESAWKVLGALPAHERSLRRWFNGDHPDRDDFPSAGDVNYERKRLREAILQVLEVMSSIEPLNIVVFNAQSIPQESAQIIQDLESRGLFKGTLLLQYDWSLLSPEKREAPWMEDYKTYVTVSKGFHVLENPTREKPSGLDKEYDPPSTLNLPLCREFLSCELGLELLTRLQETSTPSPDEVGYRLFLQGWFYDRVYPSKSAESAFSRGEAVTAYLGAIESGGPRTPIAEAMVDLALLHFDMGDLEESFDWADRSRNFYEPGCSTAARAEVIWQMTSLRRKGLGDWEIFEAALHRLEEAQAYTTLVYGLLYCIPVDLFLRYQQRVEGYLERGLVIAKKMGHLAYLSSAFHLKSVMISMTQGEVAARPFLEECLRIRDVLGDKLFYIIAHNGLAYSYLNQWRLGDAFSSLEGSFGVLKELRDFNELGMTLYNMAMIYFQGRNFSEALELLIALLQIMHALRLRKLPFVPMANIALFRAYCLLEKGNDISVLGFTALLEKDKGNLTEPIMPLYNLLRARLRDQREGKVGNPPEIDWSGLSMYGEVQTRIRPFFHLEWALHCRSGGAEAACLSSLEEGLLLLDNDQGGILSEWFEKVKKGEKNPTFVFPALEKDLPHLVNLAKHENHLRGMQRKLQNIQFVNRMVSALARCTQEEEMLETLQGALSHHYPSADISILVRDPHGNQPKVKSSGSLVHMNILKNILLKIPPGIYNPREELGFSQDFPAFASVLIATFPPEGGVEGGVLIGSETESFFRAADKDLFNLLLSNFTLKFLALRQNAELEFQAHYDSLSQLNNRLGLYQRMSIEQGLLARRSLSALTPRFSVCFLDLDNFKHYNDTYGHQVGDFLIAEMGKLLKSTFRETDTCARFGGDEFVVLLPDTTSLEAMIPSQRLLDILQDKGGFEKEIGNLLGQAISIPPGHCLSCSIGIASLDNVPSGEGTPIEALLKMADEALYKAKAQGKSRVVRGGPTT